MGHPRFERTTEQVFRADGRISESKASGPGLSEQRSVFGYDPDGNATSVSSYKDGSATPNVSELTAGYTGSGEIKDWTEKIYPPTGAAHQERLAQLGPGRPAGIKHGG